MIGQTISHYHITEKLGEGGMGVVYRAEDTKLRRTVALKFPPIDKLTGDEDKSRFVREAQAAAALNHPNICTVYEIDESDGYMFIAMEFVEGHSVKEMMQARPLPLNESLTIAIQAAEGLHVAHDQDIVHRDIKPANLMVTARGQVKVRRTALRRRY
jgi:serine/threonine protein kinase